MRTNLYVVMAFALSSCAGKGFMKQKYTHFAHHQKPEKSIIPSAVTDKTALIADRSKDQAGEVQSSPSAEKDEERPYSRQKAPKEKYVSQKEVVPLLGLQVSANPVQTQKADAFAGQQRRGLPHFTPFEAFLFALALIFIFFILPAAFIIGIVWMFFNLWLGALIAGSAALIFGTIVLIAANS